MSYVQVVTVAETKNLEALEVCITIKMTWKDWKAFLVEQNGNVWPVSDVKDKIDSALIKIQRALTQYEAGEIKPPENKGEASETTVRDS